MSLSWKDGLASVLALSVIGFSYLMINGAKIPLISGYRLATLVLLFIGIGMCALSSYTPETTGVMITSLKYLGIASAVLAIAALVLGTQLSFLLFAGSIILLWILATARHLFS